MRIFLVFAGLMVLGTQAHAETPRDVLAKVVKCADIAEAAERLKCFDTAVPSAQVVLTMPPAQQSEQQQQAASESDSGGWFGFGGTPTTKPEDFGRPPAQSDRPRELREIGANVTELAKTALGRSIFFLDNGQVWRQIDSDDADVDDLKQGQTMKVTIEKGMFTGYNLKINGRNGLIKVRRIK